MKKFGFFAFFCGLCGAAWAAASIRASSVPLSGGTSVSTPKVTVSTISTTPDSDASQKQSNVSNIDINTSRIAFTSPLAKTNRYHVPGSNSGGGTATPNTSNTEQEIAALQQQIDELVRKQTQIQDNLPTTVQTAIKNSDLTKNDSFNDAISELQESVISDSAIDSKINEKLVEQGIVDTGGNLLVATTDEIQPIPLSQKLESTLAVKFAKKADLTPSKIATNIANDNTAVTTLSNRIGTDENTVKNLIKSDLQKRGIVDNNNQLQVATKSELPVINTETVSAVLQNTPAFDNLVTQNLTNRGIYDANNQLQLIKKSEITPDFLATKLDSKYAKTGDITTLSNRLSTIQDGDENTSGSIANKLKTAGFASVSDITPESLSQKLDGVYVRPSAITPTALSDKLENIFVTPTELSNKNYATSSNLNDLSNRISDTINTLATKSEVSELDNRFAKTTDVTPEKIATAIAGSSTAQETLSGKIGPNADQVNTIVTEKLKRKGILSNDSNETLQVATKDEINNTNATISSVQNDITNLQTQANTIANNQLTRTDVENTIKSVDLTTENNKLKNKLAALDAIDAKVITADNADDVLKDKYATKALESTVANLDGDITNQNSLLYKIKNNPEIRTALKGDPGTGGSAYIPVLDDDGNLSWQDETGATITSLGTKNIRGQQGTPGQDGATFVPIFNSETGKISWTRGTSGQTPSDMKIAKTDSELGELVTDKISKDTTFAKKTDIFTDGTTTLKTGLLPSDLVRTNTLTDYAKTTDVFENGKLIASKLPSGIITDSNLDDVISAKKIITDNNLTAKKLTDTLGDTYLTDSDLTASKLSGKLTGLYASADSVSASNLATKLNGTFAAKSTVDTLSTTINNLDGDISNQNSLLYKIKNNSEIRTALKGDPGTSVTIPDVTSALKSDQNFLDSVKGRDGTSYTLKGSVQSYTNLPTTDNIKGDGWYVKSNGLLYVYSCDSNNTNCAYPAENDGLPFKGDDGATFVPNLASDGTLSWTKGSANAELPTSQNIKGQKGDDGATFVPAFNSETGKITWSRGTSGQTPSDMKIAKTDSELGTLVANKISADTTLARKTDIFNDGTTTLKTGLLPSDLVTSDVLTTRLNGYATTDTVSNLTTRTASLESNALTADNLSAKLSAENSAVKQALSTAGFAQTGDITTTLNNTLNGTGEGSFASRLTNAGVITSGNIANNLPANVVTTTDGKISASTLPATVITTSNIGTDNNIKTALSNATNNSLKDLGLVNIDSTTGAVTSKVITSDNIATQVSDNLPSTVVRSDSLPSNIITTGNLDNATIKNALTGAGFAQSSEITSMRDTLLNGDENTTGSIAKKLKDANVVTSTNGKIAASALPDTVVTTSNITTDNNIKTALTNAGFAQSADVSALASRTTSLETTASKAITTDNLNNTTIKSALSDAGFAKTSDINTQVNNQSLTMADLGNILSQGILMVKSDGTLGLDPAKTTSGVGTKLSRVGNISSMTASTSIATSVAAATSAAVATDNINDATECNSTDYMYWDTTKTKCLKCPDTTKFIGGSARCQCIDSMTEFSDAGGVCNKVSETQARCNQTENMYWNIGQDKCLACPGDSYYKDSTCICQGDNMMLNTYVGKCLECPPESIYNPETRTCTCANKNAINQQLWMTDPAAACANQ
ncbi:MAG: hypothetical protein J6W41_00570 [Alphaproteobacteria bacterium]|nr:hypothetical protein [Alphaproteobacteria bacterium]